MIKHKPNIQKDEKIKIHNTNNTLPSVTGIFCTYDTSKVLESYEGNKIICPVGFSIEIEDVFFGRRVNDNKKCIKDENGNDYPENWITVSEEEKCELKPLDKVKKLCDDNRSCYIKPSTIIYGTPCSERSLYMDVTYHCKPKEIQEPKFEIIMFADKVKKDSVYENAISEFAQYADAYNYGFSLEDQNIIKTRSIYYMKLYYILEHLMDAMKNQSYDWLFWVDGDVVLTNPNIQLKAFIPPDDKDDIHLVITSDVNGLNAGVFLIRVHPWSIDFMMKAYTYAFYHSEEDLYYYDQSSMFHVLQNMEEDSHYIIVPQN
ncbi:hypothetical protein BCR36DRAFT_345800 [Piromyces finnis]|uniref:SUEL-type lectin domain-containing protein n=1 Tax=Piromyces finnis TaxID=1754191 RepID=A0A1Y1VHP0_9FUNG|nr:hypothetical protein BCR36DRAFT_345800 [Piromyces finnis]|eukprot:ORX56562.1 hypothetical protein BCR36DRAFT_345800 [Piromyces finnis]